MNRRWSAKRTRLLLRRLRSPDLLERDPVARALRQVLATATAREAVLAAIAHALPNEDALRASIMLVDVEGRSTKSAAGELNVVRRHFFRWRNTAMLRVGAAVEQLLNRRSDIDVAAVAEYAAGERLWRHRSAHTLAAAIRHFERAGLTSNRARILCGTAKAHLIRAEYLLGSARHEFDAAEALCNRAEELDPQCPDVFVVRADIAAFRDHDVARARNLIAKALALDPQSRDALLFGVWHAAISGDTALALGYVHDLLETVPDAADTRTAAGVALHFAERFDEAITLLRSVVETDPAFAPGRYHLAASFTAAGMFREALAQLDAVPEFAQWQQFRALRYRCRIAGDAAVAPRDIEDLSPYQRAVAVLGGGDLAAARGHLASIRRADCPWLPLLRGDPLLRELRETDEFRELAAGVRY